MKSIIIATLFGFFFVINAQEAQKANKTNTNNNQNSIQKEFSELENGLSVGRTDAEKEKQIKSTLVNALKQAIMRKYRYKGYQDIKESEITYQQPSKIHQIYYVKYKEYVAKFVFDVDPRNYFAFPTEERILVKKGTKIEHIESTLNEHRAQKGKSSKPNNSKKS